jgi:two-component system LytT family response regulator
MFRFSVFVADHEILWRRRVRRYLSLEPGCELVGECATAEEARSAVFSLRPDILFLTARFVKSVVQTIQGPLPVIVTSGDAEETAARLHLAKPFNVLQFRETLERAKRSLVRDRLMELYESVSRSPRYSDRIAVRDGGRVVFIKVEAIDWIEAADNYVCIHSRGATHVIRETMKTLESRLDPARFPRIHRSAIVNLDRVRELQPWFRGDYRVLLQDGTVLTLSKSHRNRLESLWPLGGIANGFTQPGAPALRGAAAVREAS